MKLRRINTGLFIAIIVVNAFVILLPLWPMLSLWLRQQTTDTQQRMHTEMRDPSPPEGNRLIIPDILFNEKIHDGPDARTLNQGLWRRPLTSTPGQGSNTVITGHRFTYDNPNGTFYHLNKLKPGSEIGVFWEDEKYIYEVTDTFVVSPDAVHVEAPTDNATLTLYTCTPLWNPVDRLIVVAELISAPFGQPAREETRQ